MDVDLQIAVGDAVPHRRRSGGRRSSGRRSAAARADSGSPGSSGRRLAGHPGQLPGAGEEGAVLGAAEEEHAGPVLHHRHQEPVPLALPLRLRDRDSARDPPRAPPGSRGAADRGGTWGGAASRGWPRAPSGPGCCRRGGRDRAARPPRRGAAGARRSPRGSSSRARQRERTRSTLPSITGAATPKAMLATAAAV